MQITINPADENPSTLRAVALMLSSIASDRDGGKSGGVALEHTTTHTAGDLSRTVTVRTEQLPANPGNAHDAPGASDQSQTPPPPPLGGATAQTDSAGSDNSELDVNGLPWDARIHSSSKNKNQDGTWRYTRGGDPEVRARVEAALRSMMAEGAPATVESQSNDAPPPPPPVTQQQQETPPPPPPLETAAPAPAENPDLLKQQAFKRLSSLTPEQRTEALGLVGLATPADFLKEVKVRPELAGELIDAIVALTGEE